MRFSLKKTAFTLCIFLTGIFISELIAHEPLIYRGTQGIKIAIENAMALDGFWTTFWTAFTGIATFGAALIALSIAKSGWDRTEKSRAYDMLIEKALNADITYLNFHHLSRNARLVVNSNFSSPEFEKVKFEELYDRWCSSLLNERMADSIIQFGNWPNSSFTDDLELRLNGLVRHHNGNKPLTPDKIPIVWEEIRYLLEIASNISYLRLIECRIDAKRIYEILDKELEESLQKTKQETTQLIKEYKNFQARQETNKN